MNTMAMFGYAALLLGADQAGAVPDATTLERIAVCAREADDARRLACYDAQMGHLTAAAPPRPVPRDTPAAAPPASTASFGIGGSELARQRQVEGQSQTPKRLVATVTALSLRARGQLVVTLDNGQIWAQKKAESYFPLQVGDSVTILAGALGSFRLIAANRATAVTRVR